jgi:hypothetical protein
MPLRSPDLPYRTRSHRGRGRPDRSVSGPGEDGPRGNASRLPRNGRRGDPTEPECRPYQSSGNSALGGWTGPRQVPGPGPETAPTDLRPSAGGYRTLPRRQTMRANGFIGATRRFRGPTDCGLEQSRNAEDTPGCGSEPDQIESRTSTRMDDSTAAPCPSPWGGASLLTSTRSAALTRHQIHGQGLEAAAGMRHDQ